MSRMLNLGCGKDIRSGWVNVDVKDWFGVDVVADLNLPFPFPNRSFSYVLVRGVYEHIVNRVGFWKEIRRVMTDDGTLEVRQDSYTHTCAWGNPEHKIAVSYYLFSYHLQKEYGFKIIKTNWSWWAWLLERFGFLQYYHVFLQKDIGWWETKEWKEDQLRIHKAMRRLNEKEKER